MLDLIEGADEVVQLRQVRLAAVLLENELGPRLCLVHHRGRILVVELEDLFTRKLVGQARNAPGAGARAVGDQEAAFAPQEVGHLLLLGGTDGAVEQRGEDGLVRERLDVLVFEVHRNGPQDDVDLLNHPEDVLGEIHNRLLAASAGRAPVKGHFWLRHGPPPFRMAVGTWATLCSRRLISRSQSSNFPGMSSGPSTLIFSTISLVTALTCSPSAAEIHSSRSRSSATPDLSAHVAGAGTAGGICSCPRRSGSRSGDSHR